jgi:hypothetical protein
MIGCSLQSQRTKPVSGEFQVPFRRFPGSLFEGVKHVDILCELSHIKHSMIESCVDADFPNTGSQSDHWLPVVRFKPLLDANK